MHVRHGGERWRYSVNKCSHVDTIKHSTSLKTNLNDVALHLRHSLWPEYYNRSRNLSYRVRYSPTSSIQGLSVVINGKWCHTNIPLLVYTPTTVNKLNSDAAPPLPWLINTREGLSYSTHLGDCWLKCNPGVYKLKRGLQHFKRCLIKWSQNAGVVWMLGVNIAIVVHFKMET